MWSEEAIGRIASSLGIPIEAKAMRLNHSYLLPPLETCTIIGRDFNYPSSIRIRSEGNEGEPRRDLIVNVEYKQRMPFCRKFDGYEHWPQQCRGAENARLGEWNNHIAKISPVTEERNPNECGKSYPIKNSDSNSNYRTRRSHRRRLARKEHRRATKEYMHTRQIAITVVVWREYRDSRKSQENITDRIGRPSVIEMVDNQQLQIEAATCTNTDEPMPDPISDPKIPVAQQPISDTITPVTQNEKSTNGEAHEIPAETNTNSRQQPIEQIEGYSLLAEVHASRVHILYNLPNLESLPRRSSSMISYLNALQRKLRLINNRSMSEDEKIQSRIRTTEERIANIPIQLQNRFQILQRGPSKQRAASTKSL